MFEKSLHIRTFHFRHRKNTFRRSPIGDFQQKTDTVYERENRGDSEVIRIKTSYF